MTDRELLELAAKAAGINLVCKQLLAHGMEVDAFFNLFEDGRYGCWNPLEDDGDALRLAVKLGLKIEIRDGCACVEWVNPKGNPARCPDYLAVPVCADPYAATRRAIVRAAAEIGKELK